MSNHKFKTNIPELIRKLGINLYNDPIVAIRELVQNANDACILAEGLLGLSRGRIDISINRDENTLEVIDTGIGMTAEDMHQFLSTIASSKKSELRQQLDSENFEAARGIAGQFGIGFLSTFIIADTVLVESRHQSESSPGSIWESLGDGNYSIYPSPTNLIRGTRVVLHLKSKFIDELQPASISEALLRYCPYIRTHYHVNKSSLPINHDLPPWDDIQNGGLAESYILNNSSCRPLTGFYIDHKGAVSIKDEEIVNISVKGYLAIPDKHMYGNDNIKIYTSGLYVGEIKNGLPPWASFIIGGVECPDLDLTLGRDNVMDNPIWDAVKKVISKKLNKAIVDDLSDPRSRIRQRWERVFKIHREDITNAAVRDASKDYFGDDNNDLDNNKGKFYLAVRDLIPFEIGDSYISISRAISQGLHLERDGKKYMFYHAKGYRSQESSGVQEALMYDEAGMHFISAPNYYDRDFIQQYASENTDVELLPVEDGLEHLINFDDVDTIHEKIVRDTYLALGINAKLGVFAPEELAGVILPVSRRTIQTKKDVDVNTPEGRSHVIELMTSNEFSPHNRPYTLVVNESNLLIQELLKYSDKYGVDTHVKGAFNQVYFLSVLVFGDTNTATIANMAPSLSTLVLSFIRRSSEQEVELDRLRKMLSGLRDSNESYKALISDKQKTEVDPRSVFVGYGYDPSTNKLGSSFIKMLRGKGINAVDGKVDSVGSLSAQIIERMKKCSMFVGILTPREAIGSNNKSSPSIWVIEEKGIATALGMKVLMIVDEKISREYFGNTEGDSLRIEVANDEGQWLESLTDAVEVIEKSLPKEGVGV